MDYRLFGLIYIIGVIPAFLISAVVQGYRVDSYNSVMDREFGTGGVHKEPCIKLITVIALTWPTVPIALLFYHACLLLTDLGSRIYARR